jgi:uncharacterized protein (TIGR03067 family)
MTAGVVSITVAALTEGVPNAMFVNKISISVIGTLTLVAVLVGGGFALSAKQPPAAKVVDPESIQPDLKKPLGLPVEEKTKVSTAAPEAKEAAAKKLEGVWTVISVKDANKKTLDSDPIFNHTSALSSPTLNARLTLRAGRFTLKSESGPVSLVGVYEADPSTTPNQITLTIAHRPGLLLSIPGTYTLDGDNLTATFDIPASEAARLAGNKTGVFYTLKRTEPKGDAAGPQPPGALTGGAIKDAAVNEMQKRLEGTWKVVSYHENGGQSVSDNIYTFKGGEWQDELGLRMVDFGTYTLVNLDTSPKQIDFVCTKGESKLKGIFMLDGDSLIVCVGRGDVRPKVFFTEKGDPNDFLVTQYKRLPAK